MFYRVEKNGEGPYRGPEAALLDGRNCQQHPGYYDDLIPESWYDDNENISDDGGRYVFAFSSLQQVYRWFKGEIHILEQYGYEIREYDEDSTLTGYMVHHGARQVIIPMPLGACREAQQGPNWDEVLAAFGPDVVTEDEQPYDYDPSELGPL